MRSSSFRLLAPAALLALLASCSQLSHMTDVGNLAKTFGNNGPQLPGVGALFGEQPTITTSIADATTDLPFLDSYNPSGWTPLASLPRGANGSFMLRPGSFQFVGQSYCLHAGTYGPTQGDGYAYAPLKGPLETTLQHILQNSYHHPDIPQHDVQSLIWALLAHAKVEALDTNLQVAAARLLSPQELLMANRTALDLVPPGLVDQAIASLPPIVQQTMRAEAELRSLLVNAHASYEELERTAVLLGAAPVGPGSREVASSRWSYQPRGYFVRYLPHGYSTTTVEVSVPRPSSIERDKFGRIRSLTGADGTRVETEYDNTVQPLTFPGDPGVRGYALRSVRVVLNRRVSPDLFVTREHRVKSQGWVLVGTPAAATTSVSAPARFADAKARYELAASNAAQVKRAVAGAGLAAPPDAAALSEAVTLGEYAHGVRSALGAPAQTEAADAAGNAIQDAWQWAVCQAGGACKEGSPELDLSEDVAAPGNTAKQRLAQSPRPAPTERHPDCDSAQRQRDEAEKLMNAYKNEDRIRKAKEKNWGYKEYTQDVVQEVFGPSSRQGKDFESPMGTNPTTCFFDKEAARESYKGYPDVSFDADVAHEEVHVAHCKAFKNPLEYNVKSDGDPEYIANDEGEAYEKKVQVIDQWMQGHCP